MRVKSRMFRNLCLILSFFVNQRMGMMFPWWA